MNIGPDRSGAIKIRAEPARSCRTVLGVSLLMLLSGLARTDWLSGPAPAYRVAVQLIQAGQFDTRVYDDDWYSAQVFAETKGAVADILSPSPPTLPLLLWPIGWFSGPTLNALWAAANLGAVFLAIQLSLAALKQPTPVSGLSFILIGAVTMISAPLHEDIARGQIYIFVLLLHAIVFWAVLQDHDALGGIGLGLLLALKLNGLPIWIVLISLRRWRVLKWAVVCTVAVIMISLLVTSMDVWRVYVTRTLPGSVTSPTVAVTAYQTINGFFQHLFRFDPAWNPSPLFDAPGLAALASIVISIGLVAITWLRANRLHLSLALGAAAVLSVVLSPLAEQYHFLVLMAPVTVMVAGWSRFNFRAWAWFALAIALIVLPLPYKSPELASGPLALLAYPRLYGALIVWALLVFQNRGSVANDYAG